MRNNLGQFISGHSGNAGGRPKDERVRGTAAQALLDRGWGKAKVEVANQWRAELYRSATGGG